jgi:diacylglycerol diphosphate phosphatase / phosphatidate phosphatase
LSEAKNVSLPPSKKLWTVKSTRVRYVPVTFTNSGDIVYPSLAYPYVQPIFSSAVAGVMSALVPIVAILLCQLHPRIRSFDDLSSALLGLAYSLVTGTAFQVTLKKAIGGYRPHFLAVCEPVIPETGSGSGPSGKGFQSVMHLSTDICTGDANKIQNAMESFPSGHSEIAFAGYLYLAIYLNAHFRVFVLSPANHNGHDDASTVYWPHYRRHRPRYWKMLSVFAPILLAVYLASTLVLGHHHHWYDVVAGSLIGSAMALWGYKMVFAGVLDALTNCEPLVLRGGLGRDGDGDHHRQTTYSGGAGGRGVASGGVLPTTRQDVEVTDAAA